MIVRIFAIASILLLAGHFLAARVSADDLEVLEENLRQDLLPADPPDPERIRQWVEEQAEEGSWPDIDYELDTRYTWPAQSHIRIRARQLADAYAHPESRYYQDEAVAEAINKALEHWLREDYHQVHNWWHDAIGVPRAMARILILVEGDAIPEDLEQRTLGRIAQTAIGQTGQNRLWRAGIVLKRGVLIRDAGIVSRARRELLAQIAITTEEEGLQRDFSFRQHGPQLMTWHYGKEFVKNGLRWWKRFEGTDYALSEAQRQLIRNYLLDGVYWSAWRGHMDLSVRGRSISRGPFPAYDEELREVVERAIDIDAENRPMHQQMQAFIFGENDAGSPLVGQRHFWRSDYTVHRQPGWYASVRAHSTRTYATEIFSRDEIPQGYHLSDGAMYVMRRGDEYHNIQPVWEWRKIPGVTFRDTDEPYPTFTWGTRDQTRGNTDFVGGVTDGTRGLSVMHYDKGGVQAKKSWFFFDEGILSLGAGIGNDRTDESVLTTVNQCLLKGEVTVQTGENTKPPSTEKQTYAGLSWVHHDGIGYVFLEEDGDPVTVSTRKQSGSWHRINPEQSAEGIEESVFGLWIDHGPARGDATYAYLTLPGVGAEELDGFRDGGPLRILANEPRLQAVTHTRRDLIQAAFHDAGELDGGDGLSVSADRPCLLMLERSQGEWRGRVADPTQQLRSVTITVNGRSEAVELPRDDLAGKSVAFRIP